MTSPQTHERPSRVRWRITGLIFIVYVLMYIDRVNISIAAKYIIPEYGLSEVEFGWIFSAFVLGYALAQIPGGWLGDRFGPRRIMTWAIIWWSVFTAVTAVAGELWLASTLGVIGSFTVVRVLIGIGEAAAPPNGNRMIANWVAPGERATALGIAASGSALGAALTPPLIVWIMLTWGWREAFYVSGALGIFIALAWHWLSTDRPQDHPGVNAAELERIRGGAAQTTEPTTAQATAPTTPHRVPWRLLFGRRDLWLLALSYAVVGYIAYFYFAWFYLYLVNERGFDMTSGGFYTMAPFLTAAAAGPTGGMISDRLGRRFGPRVGRCGFAAACLAATGVLVFLGANSPDRVLAVVFLSGGIGTLFLSASAFWATTIDLAERHAGVASGFMNMGGNLGGTLSPTLTPLLAEYFNWQASLSVMSALCVLGALCWLGIDPGRALEDPPD